VVMRREAVEQGLWAYRVNNTGVGLALRAHPTTSSESILGGDNAGGEVLYPHGYVVWADMRVVDGPTVYVRVQGTTGWLFTHRDGKDTLVSVDPATAADVGFAGTAPSTPPKHDLSVGAVCAAASRRGLREIQYNEVSRVVAFAKDLGDGGTVGPGPGRHFSQRHPTQRTLDS